ncbi:hypothetical protein RB597_007083 [Gaeumannomyces tritici]
MVTRCMVAGSQSEHPGCSFLTPHVNLRFLFFYPQRIRDDVLKRSYRNTPTATPTLYFRMANPIVSPVNGARMAEPETAMPCPTLHNSQTQRIVEIGRRHTYYANERGERINLVALHRMNMQYLRMRLLDEAVDMFKRGDMDDDNSKRVTSLMQDYCTAVRDREYMREWAQRDWPGNPFHLKSERPLERGLLDTLKARGIDPIPMHHLYKSDDGPEQMPGGPWDFDSRTKTRFLQYSLAITGAVILTVPMITMVLIGRTDASLAIVCVFTILFAVGLSYFSPSRLPIELLSATAAYAAVLVVFVGGAATQG